MTPERFPPAFATGVRHFNTGRYFDAHEAFEELLDAVEGDGRWDLLVALIQVAVGYHKCAHGYVGGARMLGLGLEKLTPFPAVAWGVDVGELRRRVTEDLAAAGGSATALAERLSTSRPRLGMRRAPARR